MFKLSAGLLAMGLNITAHAEEPTVLLTGEIYSRQAQEIIAPLTNSWQARISVLTPEGAFVDQGEVVVEFDGTEVALQLEQQEVTDRTEQARTERDIARLEKEVAQTSSALEQAQVTLELATLKAEIPAGLLGAIEHAENQLTYEQALKGLEDAEKLANDKRKALAERQRQAALDQRKLELQQRWWRQMQESFVIRAEQPGYVMHGIHPWSRAKFQEGDNVQTSFHIATVASTSDLAIKVWINGIDRPRVESGAAVRVILDALPERELSGRIKEISAGAGKRQEWGKGVYYEGLVELETGNLDGLLPGMSVLVEVES